MADLQDDKMFGEICCECGKLLFLGDAVTYSVYPHVVNGLGMAAKQGILSVGQTYMDVTEAGLGDICEWGAVYEVSHRE